MNEDENKNLASKIKNKLNVKNSALYFQVMAVFNNQNATKFILSYIERWFTMVCKTNNFLEYDFAFLSKVLGSSELHITSELEVHNAACDWLSYNYKERCKFAKSLILKIRIPLLTDGVYKSLQDGRIDSCLFSLKNKDNESLSVIQKILKNRNDYYYNMCSFYYKTRYNNQLKYDFVILDSFEVKNKRSLSIYNIFGKEFKNITQVSEKVFNFKYLYNSAYVNGIIYIIGSNLWWPSEYFVEKYSIKNNAWSKLPGFKLSHYFRRLCVYMNKIYFIGGSYSINEEGYFFSTNKCFSIDTDKNRFEYNFNVGKMKTPRNSFGCTVFQEKIIVSGGYDGSNNIKSVEAYDAGSNTWSDMESMNEARVSHNLVTIKNKMFILFGYSKTSCEVFDAFSNKFVVLKQPPNNMKFFLANNNSHYAITLGKKVFFFGKNSKTVAVYDTDEDEWIEKYSDLSQYLHEYRCLKLPQI